MTLPNEPVDIWYTRCGGATASTIAIQKGLLDQEFGGSDVTLRSLQESGSQAVRESHYDHSIRAMFREGGNIPPIWARARGADTAVVGITWVDEFQSIVVRADSDIRSIAELAGKRLAVPRYVGNSIDFQRGANFHGFANGLSIAGLGRDAVDFIDVVIQPGARLPSGTAELHALFDGQVDAVFLRQASGLRLARHHGDRLRELVRLTDEPDPLRRINNGTPRPVTVHRDFLRDHPDLVARYLSVLLRADDWAQANPAQAVAAIAAEHREPDVALIDATFPKLATSLRPGLSDAYVSGLEAQKNFLFQWGFLEADFPIADWIVEAPLQEAQALIANEIATAAE